MPNESVKRQVGRRNHHWRAGTRHVAQKANHPTAFNKAAKIIGLSDKELAAKLNQRASPGTVRAWRDGRRDAPLWALMIVDDLVSVIVCASTEAQRELTQARYARAKKEAAEAAS